METIKLSDEQKDTLLKAQRIIHDVLPHIDHLEKCGEDCVAMRRKAMECHEQVTKLLQHFG